MARALINGKIFTTILSDAIIATGKRFSAAAGASERRMTAEEKALLMKGLKDKTAEESDQAVSAPWVPDPVTGYYRPANHLPQMDPAELRQLLLKH
ncbi:Late embryogenesis abundant protein Lea5 [Platanthera guangdongensis]|uniref:Late embryogenesis abundant protein Lea5 n=1 Tax=Platanthera guangdongensis TaxID=2320717 RepID=A0ABR2M6H0_9ASPA